MITLTGPMAALNTAQSFRYARLFKLTKLYKATIEADSNAETGNNFVVDNGTTLGIGTEFTALSSTQRLKRVAVWLKGTASPNEPEGTVYIELYKSDGGSPAAPTGEVLATSVTWEAEYITTSYVKFYFAFNGEVELESGEDYFLVIRHSDGSATSYVHAEGDSTSSDDGNYAYEQSGGWTGVSASALRFEVYCKPTEEMYFTSHDHALEFNGNTYTPAGGQGTSNVRSESGMKTKTSEFLGVLTSEAITDEDIHLGRYDNAQITEYMVDFMFPWCGSFYTEVYFIADIQRDGEIWIATIRSKMEQLSREVGSLYSMRCRHRFGSLHGEALAAGAGCRLDLSTYTYAAIEVAEVDVLYPKSVFWVEKDDISASMTEKWFDCGYIIGDGSGDANENVRREIKSTVIEEFATERVRVELTVQFPYAITAGDTFTFVRGCDKTMETCTDEYSNQANFGGFPYLPGRKKALWTPSNMG